MQERDYLNMSLLDAVNLAVIMSKMSKDDVGAAMGWQPGNADRIFGSGNYWMSLPSVPRFCAVVGNNVLIDWLHAQAHAGGVQHEFPALDCPELLTGMTQLMDDLGNVASEAQRAVASESIEKGEAARLVKRLLKLCTNTVHTIRGLRPIAGGAGHGNDL